MPKPPMRAVAARRLNVTPALKANIRRRYEHSAERLAAMAADLHCSIETVRNMAKREGWVRYEPPPRDLSPAARLRARAEALSPFVPAPGSAQSAARVQAPAGTQGHTEEPCHAAPGFPLEPVLGPAEGWTRVRERTDSDEPAAPTSKQGADLHIALAGELLHEVAGFLGDVRAERQRMKRAGYAKHELQAVSRVIADLAGSLNRLKPLAHRAPEPDTGTAQETAYDDMPADLDEFRDALARRIEAFFAARPDEGVSASDAAGGAAAPAS